MSGSPEADRLAELERRISMLEAFLDSSLREQQHLSTDQIRETWHATAANAHHRPKAR
jgi:hypothetical protein